MQGQVADEVARHRAVGGVRVIGVVGADIGEWLAVGAPAALELERVQVNTSTRPPR